MDRYNGDLIRLRRQQRTRPVVRYKFWEKFILWVMLIVIWGGLTGLAIWAHAVASLDHW